MFDAYESIVAFTNEYAIFLSEPVKNVFRAFGAWAALTGVPVADLAKKREAYFLDIYPGTGDALSRLLKITDETEKEATIRFLFLDETVFKRLPQTTSKPTDKIVNEMTKRLRDPALISRLIGIETGDTPIKILVSQMEPREIHMHHFATRGIFLAVGADIDLDAYQSVSEGQLLDVFKALADSSRLKIVTSLLQKKATTTELAKETNLTLSTVNHHLKQLIEANLVSLDVSSKSGKGASYTCNKAEMRTILNLVRTNIQ